MADINLREISTKNKRLKKVKLTPVQIPRNVEIEFHAQIRAYNQQFKETIRNELLPIIQKYSNMTSDGIADDINAAIEAVKQKFNYTAIAKTIATNMVTRVATLNGNKTTAAVQNALGVDLKNIIQSENLSDFVEMQIVKNAELIKSVPQESLEDIRRIIFNGLSSGIRYEELASAIAGHNSSSVFNKMNVRIKTIARTEVAKINSQIANKRLSNLGIEKAVWNATGDSRTRPCHEKRDGKEYLISEGLYSSCDGLTIQPGQEINCRCVAVPVVE